tara:strand:+ start:2820 stop:4070 length:1251 start_codon:yes stop_codon:yes gene_type:complete
MKNQIKTITLGCRLNSYESEIIKNYENVSKEKDIIVVNTCAVTSEAERQARQTIRKTKKQNPNAHIMATGCAVEINQDIWQRMPEVDAVIPNKNKLKPNLWGLKPEINNTIAIKEDANHLNNLSPNKKKTKSFIRIQNGCNHSCTFCIITLARGNSISVPSGTIINEIKKTVNSGIKEIILTGVDLTSYGEDLPGKNNLGKLIKKILKLVPDLQRLRISSLDAAEIDKDLIEAFQYEERLMPHIHLSLQSHDDIILKRMKRRHNTKDAENLINTLKKVRPNILFGADLIAGFPTETDKAHYNTLTAVKKLNLTFLHVFPYSPRPRTPASKMPQINSNVKKQRAKELRDHGEHQLKQALDKSINSLHNVLVETENGIGHSENFLTTKVLGANERKIYKCKIIGVENNMLVGKINGSI